MAARCEAGILSAETAAGWSPDRDSESGQKAGRRAMRAVDPSQNDCFPNRQASTSNSRSLGTTGICRLGDDLVCTAFAASAKLDA